MSDDLFETAESDGEPPKDGYGRYRLPHPVTGKVAGRTRVTTFAKSISDTYTLNAWSMRMALKGLTMRPDLYALTAATPLDDRDKLNEIAEQAKEAASARAAANLGTAMHAFAQTADTTGQIPPGMPPELARILHARQTALAEHRITMVPSMIERTVWVPGFEVVGTFDRWAWVNHPSGGNLHPGDTDDPGEILDDKTGRDLTYGQGEIAVQLACYANATHVLNREVFWEDWRRLTAGMRAGSAPKTMPTRCWEPMPPTRTDRAIVIHMPVKQAQDAPTAPPVVTVLAVDIKQGWEAAKLCETVRTWRKNKSLMAPLTVTVPAPTVHGVPAVLASENPGKDALAGTAHGLAVGIQGQVVGTAEPTQDVGTHALMAEAEKLGGMVTRPPTWAEKIRAASSRADLSRIWSEAAQVGEWTDELQALGMSQLSKFDTPKLG
jgi:hypothetical protein